MTSVTSYRKYHIKSILKDCERHPADAVQLVFLKDKIFSTLSLLLSPEDIIQFYPIQLDSYDYRMIDIFQLVVPPDAYLVTDSKGVVAVVTIETMETSKPACAQNSTQYYYRDKNATVYFKWNNGMLSRCSAYWIMDNAVIREQYNLYDTLLGELATQAFQESICQGLQTVSDEYKEVD